MNCPTLLTLLRGNNGTLRLEMVPGQGAVTIEVDGSKVTVGIEALLTAVTGLFACSCPICEE